MNIKMNLVKPNLNKQNAMLEKKQSSTPSMAKGQAQADAANKPTGHYK